MVRDLLAGSKRRRQKLRALIVLRWVLGVFLLFAFGLVAMYLPFLRIREVTVRGGSAREALDIKGEISSLLSEKYFFVFPKDGIFLFPQREIEKLLRRRPRIKEFHLARNFPFGLEVILSEQEIWAIGCNKKGEIAENCAFLNREGFAFAPAPLFSGTAVLKILDLRERTILGTNVLPAEALGKINFFVERLDKRLNEEVQTIEIINDDTVHIVVRNGWFLILDSQIDVERAFENLILALDSQIKEGRENLEYVDLRFPDRVFYRFRE